MPTGINVRCQHVSTKATNQMNTYTVNSSFMLPGLALSQIRLARIQAMFQILEKLLEHGS
jgi:hypothetical protein